MSTVWRDGRLVEEDLRHDGPGTGWGVFTTVGCDGGRPFLWGLHLERLSASLVRLGAGADIRLPDEDALCRLLAAEDLAGPARLRVVGRAGVDSIWSVVATAASLEDAGPSLAPLRLVIERWPGVPSMTGHKMLNRERWDRARKRAREAGADDVMLTDVSGRVLETSVANVWIRHKDEVLTPRAPACCLPGVMRRWMLDAVGGAGFRARECDVGIDDVAAADEIFVSSAVVGLRRVARVVDRRWTRWPLFERLSEMGVPAPGWA